MHGVVSNKHLMLVLSLALPAKLFAAVLVTSVLIGQKGKA